MSVWKHSGKLITAVMLLAVCLCIGAAAFSGKLTALAGDGGITMEYESELFDTDEIIEIDIRIDEDDWENLLANATAEEYCECDVVVNGETIYNSAIRAKGNTSLTTIAADPTTNRYSFKIEFDHYVDGQTCFGLDKLVLNNNYADATSMKEALIYDMYRYFGADASLYNYAKISVNGEYWGVYLALEAVEDSFMLRNYGAQSGELYKPDSMNIGGDFDMGDFDMGGFDFGGFSPSDMPEGGDFEQFSDESFETVAAADGMEMPDMGDFDMGGFGGFSLGGGGADLNYTDDDPDSYSTIWEGAKTDSTDADHERVITALRHISEGSELETYMDVDNLLRYMAVHVFSVNEDSLSGMMAHNYYLYEYNGQLNIIPWDYNLALGGMSGSSATSVVNEAIDNAFSGTDFFDTLMEDESYHAQYYEYLRRLVDEYINGGGFDLGGFGGGSSGTASSGSGGGFDMSQLPEGFDPSNFGGGELPEGFDPSDFGGGELPEDFDPSGFWGETPPGETAPEETGEAPQESAEPTPEGAASPEGENGGDTGAPSFGGSEPGNMPSFGGLGGAGSTGGGGSGSALAQYGLSLAVFAAAFIFALLYRRKPRRR